MTDYVLIYRGQRRISAIRSVRTITGYGLKISKDLVQHPQGFIVTGDDADGILKDYLVGQRDSVLASFTDWDVKVYDKDLPIDLRIYIPVTPL